MLVNAETSLNLPRRPKAGQREREFKSLEMAMRGTCVRGFRVKGNNSTGTLATHLEMIHMIVVNNDKAPRGTLAVVLRFTFTLSDIRDRGGKINGPHRL